MKRAIAIWRLRKHVIQVTPPKVKEIASNIVQSIQYGIAILSYPLNTIRKIVFEHPIVQRIFQFFNRLRKALRPIYWPLGISIWSTTIQMGQIHGIGTLWKTLRFTIDPISFMINQFTRLFNTKAQIRKAIISLFMRHKSQSKTTTSSSSTVKTGNDDGGAGRGTNNYNPAANAKGAGKVSEGNGKPWFRRNPAK